MQYTFYFDQSRCSGCNTCTVACKDWNNVNPGAARWRKQQTHELAAGAKLYSLVMSCNHCENPACRDACTAGAISRREDGIVIVDRNRCLDLKLCLSACPFSAPQFADSRQETEKGEKWRVAHPMQKCNFCMERILNGEKPVCVASCPSHALDCGDMQALMQKYPAAERLNIQNFPYAYKTGGRTDTQPSLLIKKRKPLEISAFVEAEIV